MARIQSYTTDQVVTASDKWIGSDGGDNNNTKNFTATGVGQYINENNIIKSPNNLKYTYVEYVTGNIPYFVPGVLSFDTGNLLLSVSTLSESNVQQFINCFLNRNILLQREGVSNNFALYNVTSTSTSTINSNVFVRLVLTIVSSNLTLSQGNFFISLL